MNCIEVISSRRSIRHYKDGNINDDIILDIINAGRLAPSAKNRQPWFFAIVKDDLKNQIADIMINYANTKKDKYISLIPSANVIKESNVLIIVLKTTSSDWENMDTLSIGACVENMLLRSTELDIGSLWIGDINHVKKDVLKLINHEDMILSCAICLGISNCSPKQRPRKQLDEIVEWI